MNTVTAVAIAAIFLLPAATIGRSPREVRAFRVQQACPATHLHHGPCPGWHVDHIIPLCAGGEDRPPNMQWIAVDDHRFKTLVDVRECRKMRAVAQRQVLPGSPE